MAISFQMLANEETVLLTSYTIAQMRINDLSQIRNRLQNVCYSKNSYKKKVLNNMINEVDKEIVLKKKMQRIDDEWWAAKYKRAQSNEISKV